MVLELKDELKKYPKLGEFTTGERYYKVRELLNNDIEKYISALSQQCVSKTLFETPLQYQLSPVEKKVTSTLYYSDLRNEIKQMLNKIMVDDSTSIWEFDTFIKRLKDSKIAVSYLDISSVPDSILDNLISKNKHVSIFQFTKEGKYYIRLQKNVVVTEDPFINLASFKFSQLENVNLRKSNINNLFEMLIRENKYSSKLEILTKLIKLINKNYSLLSDRKIFWDVMYEIGNEYYPDDESNFIENHRKKNRNSSLMTGCYYGQIIILKDGTSKNINYNFPLVDQHPEFNYRFKITSMMLSDSSPFYIHVNIIKMSSTTTDRRREPKGLVCTSHDQNNIIPFFPRIDPNLKRKEFCKELLHEICEMQSEMKDVKFVYTPFERS
jgi:hypothetical protein